MAARNNVAASPLRGGESRDFVTDQDNDVTTTVAGSAGWETVWDLSPGTDVYYFLLEGDHPSLGSLGNLRFRMQLPQDGGASTQIGDNAKIRIVARGPEQDTTGDRLGRVYRYREFSNPDQFDADDVNRLNLPENVEITEGAHLEVQVNNSVNSNDVDLSQSGGYLHIEAYRGTES